MDSYDIFKKLTKGLKFKTRVLHKKIEKNINDTEQYVEEEIKLEEDDFLSESDVSCGEPQIKSENENQPRSLELIKGVTVGEKRSKKHKEKSEDLQNKLELEEQNRYRNQHGIRAVGRHIPAALEEFCSLKHRYGVSEALIKSVKECGYTEPTPVQRQAIPCMLEDRQIFACAPTGSGKTAAFLLPILHTLGLAQGGPRALILCPTRELAKQIYREALRLSSGTNLRCSFISKMKESKLKSKVAAVKKSDIIISTPNRLCYLLSQEDVKVTLDRIKWVIIDEADKLFEGSTDQVSDFRQQLVQIMTSCDSKDRRVAMFSATHTPTVAKWARHNMRGLISVTVGNRNAANKLVEQELLYCGNESGKLIAVRQLIQSGLKPPVLVFVQSKDRARQLFKELIYDGINVDMIHADRTQTQRDNVVRNFRTGMIWVLICTELMGRGIDFCGVNLVINYDFPPSAISYIHRIGRAGRAGRKGKAITYFTQDDVTNLRSIAAVIKESGCEVPEYMLQLKQDANKRKHLMKKAPFREQITTILDKNAKKRKLEENEEDSKEKKNVSTHKTKNVKNKKSKKL